MIGNYNKRRRPIRGLRRIDQLQLEGKTYEQAKKIVDKEKMIEIDGLKAANRVRRGR